MTDCDKRLEEALERFSGSGPTRPLTKTPRKNQLRFNADEPLKDALKSDATAIDGLDDLTVMTLLCELGPDLHRFPTEKHFVSYLGLAPCNRITGGRIKKSRTKKNASRASTAFRVAAQSLHGSQSALGAFYRRMKARLGPPKAITATARKLACAYYRLLARGTAYEDPGAKAYEERFRAQRLKRLMAHAKQMGFAMVPDTLQNMAS